MDQPPTDDDRPQPQMPQMLYVDKATVDAILEQQSVEHAKELRIWRRLAIAVCVGLLIATVVIGRGVGYLIDVSDQRDDEIAALKAQAEHLDRQNQDIIDILDILEERNLVFQQMIITVDCNTRGAIQDLIDQIEALAGEMSGITVITPECAEDP